jgi:D-3-phosphoglycerate dehydrogenase
MASNKKKIFITQTMAPCGRALLQERDDIELVEFPNLISAVDFEALLKAHAPVHAVALGATRFGEVELDAAQDMKVVTRIGVGFDVVDVPALSRRKVAPTNCTRWSVMASGAHGSANCRTISSARRC